MLTSLSSSSTVRYASGLRYVLTQSALQENELYVNLRIGPYVCAEWNYGGFPIWLKFLDGIVFRDYSAPFMTAMQNWMTYVVNYLKPYFASNGGPVRSTAECSR